MDPGRDASNCLKLNGTVFLYSTAIYMHYRQLGCAKRLVNYRMSKLLKAAFAAQMQCSHVGALQPRARGIPLNVISGSHNRTGSAPRDGLVLECSSNVWQSMAGAQ
jgi:hypothetical protein